MDYQSFIEGKRINVRKVGFSIDAANLNPMLFDFQVQIVSWALRRGRAALFEDCGLGKTPQQLEWAKHVQEQTGKPVLILTPLAVADQTEREAGKFGIDARVVTTQREVYPGINITNYQKLHHFNPHGWGGIVLDESSILKGFDGKTRKALTEFANDIPYRLCCTATPAPNDFTELLRHAEFLGIMEEKEIKALFFTQDGNSTTSWRLKRHAREDFWRWLAQWSVAIRRPSDLGYEDGGFELPALNMHHVVVDGHTMDGSLIPMVANTLSERRAARRASLNDRVAAAADMVNNSTEPWLIWCDLNKESEMLAKAIPDAVEVAGRHSDDHKKAAMMGFSEGRHRVLVTKPTIAGFGMNWQHCHNMAFVGISDSYEQQYQAIRRCWRFGQTEDVDVFVVTATTEGAVVDNIRRKEEQATAMFENVVRHMKNYQEVNEQIGRQEMTYEEDVESGVDWTMYLGDSVMTIDNLKDDSVGLIIFSPPFPGMYVYTNSAHDMGNVKDNQEMIEQFRFLARKMLAKLMPGRNCVVHLTQGTATVSRDGYTGMKDFRGQVISMFESEGWIYYGETCIDKNPQVKAIRTKDHGLMFKSLAGDSAKMHMALADYLIQFRKPGVNESPIEAGISERYDNLDGWVTNEEWIRWARPVWYAADWTPEEEIVLIPHDDGSFTVTYRAGEWDGIAETDVLNVRQARETDDERHLCPLQLGVIERAVKLWSAPGELVYSPFAGIGSEGVQAIKLGRHFVGGELKRSYFNSAVENLTHAEQMSKSGSLLALMKWS